MKPRLLIITSHPIQYQAPWFRALHSSGEVDLNVLFLSLPDAHQQGVGFENAFEWDVPLLDGYKWTLASSATGGIRDGWWGLRMRAAEHDLLDQRPDAVLVTGWQNLGLLQCLRAACRSDLPVLLRAESNGLRPLSSARRARSRWIASHANILLPIGTANSRFYEQCGLGDRIGAEVPYFVDNQFFAARAAARRERRDETRRRWGIPESACCFLFAGKFIEKKRPHDLLAAFEKVDCRLGNGMHLLLVGTGTLEAELQERARAADLPVSFTGFLNQTEIPAAYAASDVLVLPSDYGETWGLVVNEGMACGLPAIVSNRVGCGPDLIIGGETGFAFRFGDVDDLAERMTAFATMGEKARKSMGETARARVCADCSVERAVENTIAATRQLLGWQHEAAAH